MVPSNKDLWKQIGFGLYCGAFITIVPRILEKLIPFEYALAGTMIVAVTIGYPFFVRGTVNIWTKDKRKWSFLPFIMAMTAQTILVFFVARLLLSLTPQD